jgi:hypothetical protein
MASLYNFFDLALSLNSIGIHINIFKNHTQLNYAGINMICVPYADSNIFESDKFWVAHGEICKFLKSLGQEMFM